MEATVYGDWILTEDEAREHAEKLKDAMDGLGTNEKEIVKVLVNHNNCQRQTIKGVYEASYGQALVDDLKSELSSDLANTIVALLMPPVEYEAYVLHEAIHGVGTEEQVLIGVLGTVSNEELEEIKEKYQSLYECSLEDDLDCDTSGDFARLMRSLVTAARQEGEDEDCAQEAADKLIEAGIGKIGTDELEFNAILNINSYPQLRRIFEIYEEKTGHALEDDIDSEVGGNLKDGFLAIVKTAKDKPGYFAERLNKAMRGFGTDDDELIRLIVSRSEKDLQTVKERYQDMYGVSLKDDVRSECSSYYKQCLVSIIEGRFEEDE